MKDSKCPHAGAHWNPYGSLHGDPHSQGYHHQGDLGNILINRSSVPPPQSWPENGAICSEDQAMMILVKISLKQKSRKTGQVGNSLACGIIEYKSDTEDDAAVNEQDTPSTKKDKPINGTSSIVKIEKKNAPKLGSNVTSDAVQFEFRQTTTLNPKIILENKELPTNIIDTPNISVDNNGIGLTAHLIPNEINQIREERRILTDTKKIVSMNKNNEPLQINESPSPEAVREFPLGGFSRGNQVKILETIDNSQKDSNTREKIQGMLNNLNAQRSLSPGLTNFQKNDGTSLNKFIIDRSRTITSDDATKSEEQQLSGTKIMNSIVADNKGKHLDIIDSNNNMNIIDGHKFLGGGTTEQNQLNGKNNSEIIEPNNDNLEVNEETSRINQTASNILNQLRNANIRELLNNRKIDENETELIKENMNNKQLEPSEDKLKGSDEIEEGVKRQLILSRESASRSGGVEEVEDLALKNHAGSNDKSIKFLPDSQDIDQETLNSNNMDEFKNKTTEVPRRRSPILIKRNNFDGSRENEEVTNSNGNRKPVMQTKLRNSSRSNFLE
ncbi:SOD1 [Lepeophtheirus salmonis]|uniref:SOD1 n=1 Tax=Lepeophtheirus salmonis TaxID=72036 RepID=A0A7R8H9L1_LEPSM|nr:SOD1 [Lepeophtheirus salmonis]CAF2951337.1 SOD1 [Lepeophtheirus salmonis]